jgi:hypothetical protein
VQLWGYERRKSAGRQYFDERVRLTGVDALVREWTTLAEQFDAAFHGSVEGLPAFSASRKEAISSCQWRIGLSARDAGILATDRWLTDTLPISVCSPTAKVDVRLSMEPLSPEAAELFALDFVAQRMEAQNRPCSDTDFAEHHRQAQQRFPFTPLPTPSRAQIEERLWGMKRFMAVYTQRAHEDFGYA